MKIPVLLYHSAQVDGMDYRSNDHVAFHDDLRTIHREGFRVVPLSWVVDWVLGLRPDADLERAVALTFDDGCSLDFLDLDHPTHGIQRSFFGILNDLVQEIGLQAQPHLHATSFVIASPETRSVLGTQILAGPEWISDDWWAAADRSSMLSIQNHSWDHNHPASPVVCQRDQIKGRFDNIETYAECDAEVRQAAAFINRKTGTWPDVFASPWGQMSRYLREVYFPTFVAEHRCRAAVASDDGFVTRESPVWALPRLGFRGNWCSPEGFKELLRSAADPEVRSNASGPPFFG